MNHLEQFAAYRAYLFALACRIMGRVEDAEDLLQDTFLRWQQTQLADIRSPQAFLTTVLKNLCLNHLRSARLRREESVDPSSLEPLLTTNPCNWSLPLSVSESLASALALVLQRLPPKERAVFLLREVFDCEFEEIAKMISRSVANCRQILRRSRQHISSNRSPFAASPHQLESLARQFMQTCVSGDLEELVSSLT